MTYEQQKRLPKHWDDAFVEKLAENKAWQKYFPFNESHYGFTPVEHTLWQWSIWLESLINVLEHVAEGSGRTGTEDEKQDAIRGVAHALQAHHDEFQDILRFVRATAGKWDPPKPHLAVVDDSTADIG